MENCDRFAGVHTEQKVASPMAMSLVVHRSWSSHRFASVHYLFMFVILVAVDQESELDTSCPIAAECTVREQCVGLPGCCCSDRDGTIFEVGSWAAGKRVWLLCVSLRNCTARNVLMVVSSCRTLSLPSDEPRLGERLPCLGNRHG